MSVEALLAESERFRRAPVQPAPPTYRPRWTLTASAEGAAHLYLYDAIGFPGIEAREVVEAVRAHAGRPLQVHLNSPGGDVFAGLAIHNTLLHHGAPVDVRVEGLAASIASVVAMSGTTLRMVRASLLMMHEPRALVIGTAHDMRHMGTLLDKAAGVMAEIYARRGASRESVRAWMHAETWWTAAQAMDANLIDAVEDAALPDEAIKARASFDLSAFRSMPTDGDPPRPPRARERARVLAHGFDLLMGRAVAVLDTVEVAPEVEAFDPTKHPRHEKGVREGGRFRKADDTGTPPIVEGLHADDYAANADRVIESHRELWKANNRDKVADAFDNEVRAEVEELRKDPLVHATSAEAAANIWTDGELRSRAAMAEDIREAEEELRSLITDALTEDEADRLSKDPPKAFASWLEDIEADGILDRLRDDLPENEGEKLRGLLRIAKGTTYDEDTALGLDRYVFFHHGRSSDEYGSTKILVDNEALESAGMFATPRDIVTYSQSRKPGGGYTDDAVRQYRRQIVAGEGYVYAAASQRVGFRAHGNDYRAAASMEVKVPDRVGRDRILGFVVGNGEEYDTLINAGVPEKKIYYLPSDATRWTAKFEGIIRHAQREGNFSALPRYEDLPTAPAALRAL